MWGDDSRREIKDRVARVTPGRKAQWGKMSAPQMVCHLAESLKMALGELPVGPIRLPIRYPPLKQFIIYLAPFPKNAPTVPELGALATRLACRRGRPAGAGRSVHPARPGRTLA